MSGKIDLFSEEIVLLDDEKNRTGTKT